ncbi:TIGR02710 family CRISPR-associated CARF protein [Benzoatithermus flavus]|uniref:TIGR02710 family CRISPR-associated CARF protein n=1 Tax=Benzoatithermus flavus TaxID=3108223 RepID=A0ABU8XVU0_9PROT
MRERSCVLACTVGGSGAPIRSSIRAARPAFVLFLCSEEGGPDGRGSRPEAEAIAAELALAPDAFAIETLPADDPDSAGVRCKELIAGLRRRFPGARIVCDYTGGTKSMSAALMLAGIAEPKARVELRLMRGERRSLDRVRDGTERPQRIDVSALLADRLLERADLAWRSFGYAEAEQLLAEPAQDLADAEAVPERLRLRLMAAYRLSGLFAAWDRFDHAAALEMLAALPPGARRALAAYEPALRQLADQARRAPLVLLDLWHNAERRAARGQYDDAVARCYRAVEWTAQWVLETDAGILTKDVDLAKLPAGIRDRYADQRRKGQRIEIGLTRAWDLVSDLSRHCPGLALVASAATLMRKKFEGSSVRDRLDGSQQRGWIAARNFSILAHGFTPIGADGWERIGGWMEQHWLPWIEAQVTARGGRLEQLPADLDLVDAAAV